MDTRHRKALEHARNGDWEASHKIAQEQNDSFSHLIHAFLHRSEGDSGNAAYWYRRAGEPVPDCSVEEELLQLQARLDAQSNDTT